MTSHTQQSILGVLHVGPVCVTPPLILAPMAGVTSQPFRRLCRRHGAGLVCGEMVSAMALHYGSPRTARMMDVDPCERPVSLQILASSGELAEQAARAAAAAGADIVDINFGCAVPKVRKSGGGCVLMADPGRARDVIHGARAGAGHVPVTIKMRSGVDEQHINAVTLGELAAELGVAALILHPRTGAQGYSGKADWGLIAKLKAAVGIPVIGSGDVRQPEDAARMIEQTGCEAVMIGRAALGDPWIFERTAAYLERGEKLAPPSAEQRLGTAVELAHDLVEYLGERHGILQSRKHLAWFAKGLPRAAELRRQAQSVKSLVDVEHVVEEYLLAIGEGVQ